MLRRPTRVLALATLAAAAALLPPAPAGANALDVNELASCSPGGVGVCNGSTCGLETLLFDQGNAYVQSDHPNQEPLVQVSVCFGAEVTLPPRPNGTPGRFRIMKFYREPGNNPRQHLFVTLKRNQTNTAYRIAVLQRNASDNFEFVGEFFWGNGNHTLEIHWDKNGGANGTGRVAVFRDGIERAARDVDMTQWNVDMIRMGAIDEIDLGVDGSVYFDDFVATR